jgi:hypothetical protein
MPPKKKVDYKKLVQAVKDGKKQSEIMKEFKFNTATQFKSHYLNALMETGEVAEINTKRASSKSAPAKETFVSKRGSVVIPKVLIEEMGFTEGDKFDIRKTKSGISLKMVG